MSASEPAQGEPLVLQSPVAAVDTPAIDRSKRDMKLDYYEGIENFMLKPAQMTASCKILVDNHHQLSGWQLFFLEQLLIMSLLDASKRL